MIVVRLGQCRRAVGMAQIELSLATNISLSYLQKIEQGKTRLINLDYLDRFCKVLRCKVEDILDLKNLEELEQSLSLESPPDSLESDTHPSTPS